MDPPWDQVYARDVPPDFDEMRKREDRKERIKPHWDLLVQDGEPKINKAAFIHLMHDLKDEGNALFKESQYDIAWMHYRNAIFVARILDTRFYHTVDKEFLSSLFSNRAFCCLKKGTYVFSSSEVLGGQCSSTRRPSSIEMYSEAVQDCESAIKVFPNNLKAYYRQTVALKHQKKYSEAIKAAKKGQEIQPISALKDLLDELTPLVPGSAPSKPAPVPPRQAAEVSAKTSLVRETEAEPPNGSSHVNEWLAGTNIGITEKHLETKGKMGKKSKTKIKNPEVKRLDAQTNGVSRNWASDTDDDDDDDSDNIDSSLGEDDEKFASQLKGVRSDKITLGDPKPGSRASDYLNIIHPNVASEEEIAWSFPHDTDTNGDSDAGRQRFKSPIGKKTSGSEASSGMGLDSFTRDDYRGNDDFDGSESSASSRHSSRTSQSPVKTFNAQRSSNLEQLPEIYFPMQDEYDFKLACRSCFVKKGEGRKGFRYVNITHNCSKTVLIVNKKNQAGSNWIKIRSRPVAKATHYGAYKICAQFSQDQPCKVGEEKCTFAHNQAEVYLWTMDRDGSFSIDKFISDTRMSKIGSSEDLYKVRAKQQYIPGLNYAGDKNRKQTQETGSSPYSKQNKQNKSVSQSNMKQPGPVASPLLQLPGYKPVPQYYEDNRMMSSAQGPSILGPPFGGFPNFPTPADGFTANPFSQPPPPLPGQMNNNQWSKQTPTVFQATEFQGVEQITKIENPLALTHEHKMMCHLCMRTPLPGLYEHNPAPHKCEENMLAMRQRFHGGPWVRVRERKNHREFPGNYLLCRCITYKNPKFCKYGEEACSFAHNDVEQRLWTLEKDGQFNVTEFIMQNRKVVSLKGFTLKEILIKHAGYFEFICRSCFYSTPSKIAYQGTEVQCGGKPPHPWIDFRILAHIGPNGVVTLINPRGFLHKTAFFKICKWLHFCRTRVNAECRFAHSIVERDVWMLERDSSLSREEIVSQSKQLQNIAVPSNAGAARAKTTEPAASAGSSGWAAVAGMTTLTTSSAQKQASVSSEEQAAADHLCPVTIVEVCQTCWKNGQRTLRDGDKDRCLKQHANWNHNRTYLISPSYRELRPLPRKIPSGLNFIECKNMREKGKCGFTGVCQFAHCPEELEAWKWMCSNGFDQVEQVAEASKAAQKLRAESVKQKISGQSVVSVSHTTTLGPAVRPAVPVGSIYTYYCQYCGVTCNSQKQWDEHRASDKHNFNVDSDKEHQWNYRQPPWNKSGLRYQLCARHIAGNKCQYSNVPDMYNLCPDAHSQEELDEWKERYEWRQMKREMARQEQVFSYMDQLREKYEASHSSVKVITESLEGVDVTVDGDLHIYKEQKRSNHNWTFMVKTKLSLEKVSLLYNRDRLHFCLVGGEKAYQIAQGETFAIPDALGQKSYRVRLQFSGGMFGSFQQWVIFDFGSEPVLCKKITVEVGDQESHIKVKKLREQLTFDRWTSQNREIVRHDFDCNHPLEGQLQTKYKEPSSSEMVVNQATVMTELNRHNYRQKMHKLLELEEMTRHQIISSCKMWTAIECLEEVIVHAHPGDLFARVQDLTEDTDVGSYNLRTAIECLDSIQEEVYVFAHPGELFARVPLQEHLTEDTDAGRLILSSVRNVLLAPQDNADKVVYEAVIVREENFNYDGRGRDYIYLCLSPTCVRQMKIKKGVPVNVEIQFQMDRLFFCRMHYSVDQLSSPDIVFPDVPKINPLRNERHNLTIRSQILNPDQMEAVRHIVAERTGYTPPFVIYGPFGTGKTETLAQAAMVLLKEKPETRILICAQSNSAADLYIVKHLDGFLKKNKAKLRRVYFKERRVYTVDPKVKNYCLLSHDQSSFEMPTKEDILNHRVVIVTVNTALALVSMGLQGEFTHIFIDEAAQTLECEALMPLALATEKTCVVLAGDHQQISPKVYSKEAENQKLHMSLLERLYNYYDSYKTLISETSPLNILLSINYRTKMEILRFISAIFYGGPDKLKSEANIRSVVDITPLMFYGVQGREVQDSDSISYYNISEVQEVVERVEELFNKWPEEWGERSAKEIAVVTPYYDQVQLIRKTLKNKSSDLRDVVVERIHGVQGREFRAMFLSTVRTRHLSNAVNIQTGAHAECDGDGGDFGFLSDGKLLNTAFTRAQSLVVVVGDPVALCAIGDCTNVWRVYLKHCQNMSSLYPQNHTLDSIKQQVQELMNSPNKGKLLQMVNQRSQQSQPTPAQSLHQKAAVLDYRAAATHDASVKAVPAGQPKTLEVAQHIKNGPDQNVVSSPLSAPIQSRVPLSIPGRSIPPAPLRLPLQRKLESYFSVGEQFTVETEDVLRQLAVLSKDGGKPVTPARVNRNEDIKPELVKVVEQNGHVMVEYGKLDAGQGGGDNVVQYDKDQLEQLVRFNPSKYVPCKVKTEDDVVYAEVIDTRSHLSVINIDKKEDCQGAINDDEAVIEVFNFDNDSISGRVVGVLQRATDLTGSIVCCVEDGHAGCLIPINSNLPRLYNVTTPSVLGNNIDGNVTVYKFTTSKQIRFSHMESVKGHIEKLFIVKFLKWDSAVQLHLCVVIGVLPEGLDVSAGLAVLDIEHHIVNDHQPESNLEADHIYHQNYQYTAEIYQSRYDLRQRWCFTIDTPVTEEINNAFSIDEVGDGSYQIGIHTSDVSFFVNKDSNVDIEARNHGQTLHPQGGEPASMLPVRLSTDLCSLKPDQDRVAVSVLLTVQPTGEVKQVSVQKSIINVKQKFTFQEADEIIQDPLAHEDYLKSCVLVLYEISRMWRKNRLGNASFCEDLALEGKLSPLSRQLVSEMLIMMQYHMAQIITGKFPLVCPLYCQAPPSIDKLTIWKHEHAADAVNSMALTKPFLEGSETCKCKVACTCIGKFIRQSNLKVRDNIDVKCLTWDSLTQAVDVDQFGYVQSIIVEPENHPQLAVAQHKLKAIESSHYYASSADAGVYKANYSLNLNPYTHCSSPISRYMDLVVQRLLLACIDLAACPYSMEEIQALCFKLRNIQIQRKSFEESVLSLHLGLALSARPLIIHPIVEAVSKDIVKVCFPSLSCISKEQSTVSVSLLSPVSAKTLVNGVLELKFQECIYSTPNFHPGIPANNTGELNPDRFIYKIPAKHWQRLLMAIRDEDVIMYQKLKSAIDFVQKQVVYPAAQAGFIEDVSSESNTPTGMIQHISEFVLKVNSFQVLQVQLSAELYHGLIAPMIQLVNITPNLDICIEHRKDPEKCFIDKAATGNFSLNQTYTDMNGYLKCWEPAVSAEAATRAVNEGKRVIIHGVAVKWHSEVTFSGSHKIAQFSLPMSFMKERQIKLEHGFNISEQFNKSESKRCQAYFADFVCVRYSSLVLPDDPSLNDSVSVIVNNGVPVTWVGHCIVTSVLMERDSLTFRMNLLQSSVPFPDVLFQTVGSQMQCTIELIERASVDRSVMLSQESLKDANSLVQCVALGKTPSNTAYYTDVQQLKEFSRAVISTPNPGQEEAYRKALQQPFTVINGAPQSGKSSVAAALACMFAQRNKQSTKGQVLLCSPNTEAMHNLAEILTTSKASKLKIVLIYDEMVTRRLHPLPGEVYIKRQDEPVITESDLSLRKQIAGSTAPYSKAIKEHETLLAYNPHNVSSDQVEKYLEIVSLAEIPVLKEAEVIICTCAASNSTSIIKHCNIQQIIIDDSQMCTEPETLVPLSLHKSVKHVVLIGDQSQLKPPVMSRYAREMGLQRSLFERYLSSAVKLAVHYSVHEGIMEFIEDNVEVGKLSCGNVSQRQPSTLNWPGNRSKPTVFCHVEEAQESIIGTEFDKQQIINNTELDIVIRIAFGLVNRYQVPQKSIAIVCTTSAQRDKILEKLEQTYSNFAVSTVNDLQGKAYDYVVMSTVRWQPESKIDKVPSVRWKRDHLGDLLEKGYVTMAMTRAKKGLIIFGNKHLLRCSEAWSIVLDHYDRESKLLTATDYLNSVGI